MSHVYQPLVIRTLLENNGEAPIRLIAKEFLAYDEAQLDYYIKIVKRWPKITLLKHKIIDTTHRGYFRLNLNFCEISEEKRRNLIEICNDKIREYISSYKGIIGDYRYNPEDLSSSSIRYLVLKLANGRCALCGASIKDTPLDVDHIIPRSRGGSNDLSNLQALCFRCNRAKRDNDNIDFRKYGQDSRVDNCTFCKLTHQINETYNSVFWIIDPYADDLLHSLIVPKRHVNSTDDLSVLEMTDMFLLAKVVKRKLVDKDPSIKRFNILLNDERSFSHAHLQVIPIR